MHITCREILFGSPEYEAAVELRAAVLRRPLGLDWEAGAFDGEEKSFHLGVFSGMKLVGCLVLKPIDDIHLKMRQVAIAPEVQGQGVGSRLIAFAEHLAHQAGFRQISAHARETVIPFYRKLGYSVSETSFLELSIPHFLISKDLA